MLVLCVCMLLFCFVDVLFDCSFLCIVLGVCLFALMCFVCICSFRVCFLLCCVLGVVAVWFVLLLAVCSVYLCSSLLFVFLLC